MMYMQAIDGEERDAFALLQQRIADLEQKIEALEQQKRQLATFETLVQNSLDGITITSLDGQVVYANPAMLTMMGYGEQLLGMHLTSLFAEEPGKIHGMISHILQHASWQGVLACLPRHASSFKGHISVVLICDSDGQPRAMAGIVRDITGQIKLEEQLRESQAMLQGILNNSPAAIYAKDLRGRYLLVNQQFAASIDSTPAEVVGKADYELFPPAYVTLWREHEQQVILQNSPVTRETTRPYSTERRTYIESKFPLYDKYGVVYATGGIATDITERKEAEDALRQSQALLQAIIDNSPAVIYAKDLAGRYILVNHHHAALLHRERTQLLGTTDYDLFPARFAQGWYATDQQIITSGKSLEIEEIVPLEDGLHTFLTMKFPILDENSKIYAIAGVVTDITERKRTEEMLRRANVEVEQRIQSRTRELADTNKALQDEIIERQLIESYLKRAEQFNRSILDALSAHIAVLDERGTILEVNKAWLRFAEDNPPVKSNLAQGANYLAVCDAATGPFSQEATPFAHAIRAVLNGQCEQITIEYPCHSPDEQRWFNGIVTRFVLDGTPYAVVAHENITQRKLAELSLRESEEKFHQLFEQSQDGLLLADDHGHIIEWNRGEEQILGLQRSEAIGRPIWDTLFRATPDEHKTADVYEEVKRLSSRLLAGDRVVPTSQWIEREAQLPNGTRRIVQTLMFPIHTEEHRFLGSITRDVTEQRQIEQALRASEERYRIISEMVSDFAYVKRFDAEGRPVHEFLTDAASRITGYTLEELQDNNIWRRLVHPDDRAILEQSRRRVMAGQRDIAEFRIITKSGQICWLHRRVQPIVDETRQRVIGVYGAARDITERKEAEEQIYRQVRYLSALRQIDMAIIASLDLQLTLNILLDHITFHLHVAAATVLLLNADTQILKHAADRGFRSQAIQEVSIRLGEGGAGRVVLERRPINIPDVRRPDAEIVRSTLLEEEGLTAYYGLPLIAKGHVKGVLELFHHAPISPEQEELDFLNTLTDQAAIAIEDAQLFENLQRANNTLTRAYDATIESWARSLELRNANRAGHTQRVTEMTMHLCRTMGLNDAEMVHIRRGAMLHDIGEMAIPDHILLKDGPLSAEEWQVIRSHPVHVYNLLSAIPFLGPALAIPYSHHEKWDGTGYPRGLKGEAIPLPARIFAVADVWDALRSDRPYRKAWPYQQAHAYMREQAGQHFDPQVIQAFLDLVPARDT